MRVEAGAELGAQVEVGAGDVADGAARGVEAAREAASGRAAGAPLPKPADWVTMTKEQKQSWYRREGKWR